MLIGILIHLEIKRRNICKICRFEGDFESAVRYAVEIPKEMTIGNYRNRNLSKQDKDLHDGEIQDVLNALVKKM